MSYKIFFHKKINRVEKYFGFHIFMNRQIQDFYLKNLKASQQIALAHFFYNMQSTLIEILQERFVQIPPNYLAITPLNDKRKLKELKQQILVQKNQKEKLEAQLKQQQIQNRRQLQLKEQHNVQSQVLLAQSLKYLENYSKIYTRNNELKNLVEKIKKNIQKPDQKDNEKKKKIYQQSSLNFKIEGKSSSESSEQLKIRQNYNHLKQNIKAENEVNNLRQ